MHVKATHEEGPREREGENISPPQKTIITDDLNSRIPMETDNDKKMEETPKEEKEISEANKVEEQEKETLKEQINLIK